MADDVWFFELLFFDVIMEPFGIAIEGFVVELRIVARARNIWRQDGKIIAQTISNRKEALVSAAKTMN